MEIVFEPDLHTPLAAAELLRTLQSTLRQLGTCDGNMEEGSIRYIERGGRRKRSLGALFLIVNDSGGRGVVKGMSILVVMVVVDRCDLNVSVREAGETKWGERVEVKNMNSIKSMVTAAEYEINRQIEVIWALMMMMMVVAVIRSGEGHRG